MSNLVTEKTTKEEMQTVYKDYPDTAPEGFQPFHSSRIDPIYWDIPDGATVLDVGCNSGEFMRRIIQGRKDITIKGVDISENVVKIAREKGLDVIQGDGESLPFPDSSFDYVVLMEVIVHVHEPRKLLSEIKRVLKKDGVLIGSAPHKNLEMNIWDDRRLHHAYYTTEQLEDLLYEYFPGVYTKVLKGGQFSVGMAGTYLGDKDVEVLFKAGSTNLQPWNYQLLDKSSLRVWMGPTQNPGDVYYRMSGFAEKMNQFEKCDVLYSRFSFTDDNSAPGSWQAAFARTSDNRPHNPIIVNQLENVLKVADLSVWQITASWSVLAFFHTLKAVHPNKPFVTEMDDFLFDMPSYNIGSNPYRPNSEPERIAYEQLQISDVVIVSTQFIQEKIRELFPTKIVFVVPNAIDFKIWDSLNKPEKDDKIRIGYTGCGNHSGDMEIVKKPILALLDEYPNLEYVSIPFQSWDDVNHPRVFRHTAWASIPEFPQMIANWNLDIGIAPLRDSNFNRAKSNLRWLEYSALGVPTVASKIYPFANSIRNGIDGIICNSQSQWYEALKSLIEDKSKRSRMGLEAYSRVKRDFNMDKVAEKYRDILEVIKNESF